MTPGGNPAFGDRPPLPHWAMLAVSDIRVYDEGAWVAASDGDKMHAASVALGGHAIMGSGRVGLLLDAHAAAILVAQLTFYFENRPAEEQARFHRAYAEATAIAVAQLAQMAVDNEAEARRTGRPLPAGVPGGPYDPAAADQVDQAPAGNRPTTPRHKPSEVCDCPPPWPGEPFHCAKVRGE